MAVMNFRNQFDIFLDGRANLSSVSVDVLDGTFEGRTGFPDKQGLFT